eukprot:6051710-Amphidinium_carterae.1
MFPLEGCKERPFLPPATKRAVQWQLPVRRAQVKLCAHSVPHDLQCEGRLEADNVAAYHAGHAKLPSVAGQDRRANEGCEGSHATLLGYLCVSQRRIRTHAMCRWDGWVIWSSRYTR